MKTKRLDQMQFLRVLAFFNIFMLHAGHWNFFNYPGWFGAISAVSFFFMLSGFLVGYSFDAHHAEMSWPVYRRYMTRKIGRFYPLYFYTTIMAIPISGLPQAIASGDISNVMAPLLQLAKNLLCIQSWFPGGFLSYNGPCWFLATLLFLTAMNLPFMMLIKRICQKKKYNIYLSVLTAVCFGGTVLYSYLTKSGDLQFVHYIIPVSRIGIYFGSLTMGYMLRPCIESISKQQFQGVFTVAEVGVLVIWFVSLFYSGPVWLEWNGAWILPNLLVLMVFAFGKGWISKLFCNRKLIRLGDITFESYLIHSLIIPFYSSFNKFDTTYTLGCLFSLTVCFMLTYFTAFAISRHAVSQK